MFELHLMSASGGRRLAPVGSVPLLVGRSQTSDVVLDDERVSSRHLRVWADGDVVRVRDLGSRNGTRINGEVLTNEAAVGTGDEIELGRALVLRVVLASADPPPPTGVGPGPEARAVLARIRSLDPSLASRAELEIARAVDAAEAWAAAAALIPALLSAGRRSSVLQIVVDAARAVSTAPTVAALVWSGAPGDRTVSGSAHTGDLTRLFPVDAVSTSVVEAVLATGEPTWTDDAFTDARFAEQHSVRQLELHSIGCVPLGASAALYLSDQQSSARFPLWVRARIEAICAIARPFVAGSGAPPPPAALPGMVGTSQAMGEVFDNVRAFAPMPWPMLVLGETGTGKERVANAIHELSGRDGPFVAVNCGALSDELALSQLFGHEQGAFTGADRRHVGYLERAGTGTLFLDEVGELSVSVQARLLRVLQEGTFERLGGEKGLPFKARVVAATHRPLDDASARAPFRDDLYHRLAACVVRVPPLRDRPQDIPVLAEHLMERLLRELPPGTRIRLSSAAIHVLQARGWTGNVRELENALRTGAARCLSRRDAELRPEHLDTEGIDAAELVDDLHSATLAFQARRVNEMLAACGGNRAEAARRLGVSRQFLYRLFAKDQQDDGAE